MNSAMQRLGPGKRLFLSVALVGVVHLMLLRFGSEEATPLRLLGSFVLSTSMLLVAQRIRQHLAVSTGSVSTGSTTSSPARDRNAP
jgi:hypothetical protein